MMKIEKAEMKDLDILKEMASKVVSNMHEVGIDLWTDYYPREELVNHIGKDLYVAKEENIIISFFVLSKEDEGSENFTWQFENEIYLKMFAINVDYLHKGYGKKVLLKIIDLLKEKKFHSFRLNVYDKNVPAIKLYEKIGFIKVEGKYSINEFFYETPKSFVGMEYEL